MIPLDRRSFLKAGCLAAAAGALGPTASLAAGVEARFTRVLDAPLPLDAAEEKVLEFVSRYGAGVRFIGRGVLARLRGTEAREAHLLVEVRDLAKFEAALAGATPFRGAYAEANTFSFVLDGIEFTVEHLVPPAFAARLAQLVARRNLAFAHDALSYDPATRALTDPFGAEKSGTMKLVNTAVAGAAALGFVMRGRVESDRLRLERDAAFARWERRQLALASSSRNARAIAEAFFRQLATIADAEPPATLKDLLRTRAVASALKRALGLDTAQVIVKFDRLRPALGAEISNAALWLALLIGREIERAETWLLRGTRFEVLRSRRALAEARRFLNS